MYLDYFVSDLPGRSEAITGERVPWGEPQKRDDLVPTR